MPLINIPSKSARRGTREPELRSVKREGGGERTGEAGRGSSRNIIGTTLSPLSAEIKRGRQEPRGILHFAPAAFIPRGETLRVPFAARIANRDERSYHSNFCILSRSNTRGSSSCMFKRERNAERENLARAIFVKTEAPFKSAPEINVRQRKLNTICIQLQYVICIYIVKVERGNIVF